MTPLFFYEMYDCKTWPQSLLISICNIASLTPYLFILLPIEAMISAGFEGAQIFKDQWDEVYGWLSDGERKGLSLLARSIMNLEVETFQERLEQAAFQLITKTCL